MKNISLILSFIILLMTTTTVNAMSNQAIHWGFKKGHNEQQAEAGEAYDQLLARYDSFYKGSPTNKFLYLTFDNGYENGYTAQILDVLKNHRVPATFFVTGHYLKSAPELTKRMVDEGHIIGNHSWSHPDMTQISDSQIKTELEKVKVETEKLTGQSQMQYLRPPRGILSERTLKVAQEEGYLHVLWSLAFKDWQTNQQKGSSYAYDQIMKQVHPGAVILLHTVSKDNAEALDKVLTDLKNRGYAFKSLDEYILYEQLKIPHPIIEL